MIIVSNLLLIKPSKFTFPSTKHMNRPMEKINLTVLTRQTTTWRTNCKNSTHIFELLSTVSTAAPV